MKTPEIPKQEQVNITHIYTPGDIVRTQEEAQKHNLNGGICAIKHNDSDMDCLEILVRQITDGKPDEDIISLPITEESIKNLPRTTELELTLDFTDGQCMGTFFKFYAFEFHGHQIIIGRKNSINLDGELDITTVYSDPSIIAKNQSRTILV